MHAKNSIFLINNFDFSEFITRYCHLVIVMDCPMLIAQM